MKSWIVFIIINLITQGALNIWINTAHPFESYIILYLIFAEYIILIVELLGLTFLIKETGDYSSIRSDCKLYKLSFRSNYNTTITNLRNGKLF